MAAATSQSQPSAEEQQEEQDKRQGTARILQYAAQAAEANPGDQGEEQGAPEKLSAHRRRVLSADSYYRHQPGPNDEVQTRSAPEYEGGEPPPAYDTGILGEISEENHGLGTTASVADDGRVNIRIDQTSHKLSSLLVPALRNQRHLIEIQSLPPPPYIPVSLGGSPGELPPPPLNVVIHVVGSRGDVQPFVALGKVLKETYGHRVRLATHPVFKSFVEENGLEFFTIGGDPAELMAFMVKNPGLMPGFDTMRNGDVGKRRKNIGEMISGCWRSCIEVGDGSGIEASDAAIGDWMAEDATMTADQATKRPFVADCIIANPPSFAHIHCAERLGIPLHMMFTMPWSPTEAFPHPLTNIESSNADPSISNYISYALVDMLTWQGLGDVINSFRVHSLGLEPISMVWAPGLMARLKIPYTYCWSPALIPKPADWGSHISISGFYFLSLASNYTPAPDLLAFLEAGPPPIYIGFGSIVVDDPTAMTKMIFEAVKKTGQRALVSKGWGGLGADELGVPESVFMLGNVPHDWLFGRVSCVVHHGGAGTTAAGISAGRPTVVVPFFGDQPFWGAMVARAGAGPMPVPYKKLTADILAESIKEALKPESLTKAKELSAKISKERGSQTGAQCFHQMLDVDKLRCSLMPEHAAVWRVRRTRIRLSALAAYTLAEREVISFADLKLFRPREYEVEEGPTDPISGGAGAVVGTMTSMMMGIADFPVATLKVLAIHPDSSKSKKKKKKKDQDKAEGSGGTSPSVTSSQNASSVTLPSTSSAKTSMDNTVPPMSESSELTAEPEELAPESTRKSRASVSSSSLAGALPLSPRRESSMASALRNLPEGSRPRSRSRSRTRSQSRQGSQSRGKPEPQHSWSQGYVATDPLDTAYGTGKGISKIVGAGFKSPMDLLLGVSKGFHNLPKLYGEEVRETGRVTGIKSGLQTSGKELGLGFYDGITGLVTQPLSGAKKEGAAGFIKGIGRGVAGLIVKPAAGIYALPGYAMKGVYKEIQKQFGASVDNYIIAARTAQGWEAWLQTDRNFQTTIVHRYLQVYAEAKKKKAVGEDQYDAVTDFLDKKKELRKQRWAKAMGTYQGKKKQIGEGIRARCPSTCHILGPHKHSTQDSLDQRSADGTESGSSTPRPSLSTDSSHTQEKVSGSALDGPRAHNEAEDDQAQHDADLIEAIRQSVAETSTGDVEEDRAIAKAIQVSIKELHRSGVPRSQQHTLSSAVDDEETQLRLALQESMIHDQEKSSKDHPVQDVLYIAGNHADKDVAPNVSPMNRSHERENVDEDEDLQKAIEASKKDAQGQGYDHDILKAIEESKKHDEEVEKARKEEEIVLEYMKKQSLAEEEHRRRVG